MKNKITVEKADEEKMKKPKVERAPEEDMDGDEPAEHEIEMALEDMMRVHKHKKNKKLMEAVKKKASDKKEAIESIDDLKEKRNEAFTKSED